MKIPLTKLFLNTAKMFLEIVVPVSYCQRKNVMEKFLPILLTARPLPELSATHFFE